MTPPLVETPRLRLRPLPVPAAAALPGDRATAARLIDAHLPGEWPQPDLLDVLPLHAAAGADAERFGVWLVLEPEPATVVGDIGFFGPPDEHGSVEIGYSIVPSRRRRGYAGEAVAGLVGWARDQPGVRVVVAGCDHDNVASVRVLERAGFAPDGESDGQLRWRLAL